MAALAFLGGRVSSKNMFMEFGRFYPAISPSLFFLPTSREVRELALSVLDKSKINVVLGGSSVFYGVGQPTGQTLADKIRGQLGNGYRLINLAMVGGDISGIAEQAAEMLLLEGYKIIYVADISFTAPPEPIGKAPYQYYFWDADARGYIFDWPERKLVGDHLYWISNAAMGARLNRWLNYNELWNYIGYKWVFTISSPPVPPEFWRPRINLIDSENDRPPEQRYQNYRAEVIWLNSWLRLLPQSYWATFGQATAIALPPQVRPHVLLAYCQNSPWMLEQTSEDGRISRETNARVMKETLENLKFKILSVCDGLNKDDYIDSTHLSIHGAALVAPKLAAAIVSMAETGR